MPIEITSRNSKYYRCVQCGFFYHAKEQSEQCERWCGQNKSCNLEITKGAIKIETAIFAAGCFWHVEDKFMATKGVLGTTAGFTGGHTKNPSYDEVCSNKTGHAESVEVIYDSSVISYKGLLDVFWDMHDPTQLNRQGPDVGFQYRSCIFYQNNFQKKIAAESKIALEKSGKYAKPIVTKIVPASPFYKAEEYHQGYLKKHGLSACPM